MPNRSELEIERWSKLYQSYKTKGKLKDFRTRLGLYKGSLILGRNFQESSDSYLERKDLTKFMNWNPEVPEFITL